MTRYVCSGYVVEKMNTKTGKWEPLTHTVGPDVNEFRVPKLKEGEDYKFRVRAENDQGQSDPLDSDRATKVKNPFGKLLVKFTTETASSSSSVVHDHHHHHHHFIYSIHIMQ